MLAKQANKIIPPLKGGSLGKYKREQKRSSFLLLQWLTQNKGYQGWHFLKLYNLCNHLLQLPCQINSSVRKGWSLPLWNKPMYMQSMSGAKKIFSPYPSWSNLQLHLRSLSPVHRNLCFLYCAIWCLWCLSKLSLSLAAPHLQLFTQPAFLQHLMHVEPVNYAVFI